MSWNPEYAQAYEDEMRAKRQARSDAANRAAEEQERARLEREIRTMRTLAEKQQQEKIDAATADLRSQLAAVTAERDRLRDRVQELEDWLRQTSKRLNGYGEYLGEVGVSLTGRELKRLGRDCKAVAASEPKGE